MIVKYAISFRLLVDLGATFTPELRVYLYFVLKGKIRFLVRANRPLHKLRDCLNRRLIRLMFFGQHKLTVLIDHRNCDYLVLGINLVHNRPCSNIVLLSWVVVIISLRHLLVLLRYTWHTWDQLVPFWLLADKHLHVVVSCIAFSVKTLRETD